MKNYPKGTCNPETQTEAEASAIQTGYVRSPNNIYGISGSEWYAGREGLPEIRPAVLFINSGCKNEEQHVPSMPQDKWPVALYHSAYGKPCGLVLCSRFSTFSDYLEYAKDNGTLSRPGMPAGLYGD